MSSKPAKPNKTLQSLCVLALLLAAAFLLPRFSGEGETVPEPTPAAAESTAEAETPAPAAQSPAEEPAEPEEPSAESTLPEDGEYTSKDDVALYLYTYGHLPGNFITKEEARALGWSGGGLEDYAPGKSIGGDRFGNYEGLLPEADGRTYHECDIDTKGARSRGAKRIVFSNDGLIYYTEDHYESFTLLYGDETS